MKTPGITRVCFQTTRITEEADAAFAKAKELVIQTDHSFK